MPTADPDALAGRERIVLRGDLPSPAAPPSGLPLPPALPEGRRSAAAPTTRRCVEQAPGHRVACHFPLADGELLTLAKPTIGDFAPDLSFDPAAAEEGTAP